MSDPQIQNVNLTEGISVATAPAFDHVEDLLDATHPSPFSYLGPQVAGEDKKLIRAFQPDADGAWVIDGYTGDVIREMMVLHEGGIFEADFDKASFPVSYKFRFRRRGLGDFWDGEDVYRFPSQFGKLAKDIMAFDSPATLHDRLGARTLTIDGVRGVNFALWAPGATRVSVVGEFNNWDGRRHGMRNLADGGVWEIFIPDLPTGSPYKFEILTADGRRLAPRQDPYARAREDNQREASTVLIEDIFRWTDDDWITARTDQLHQARQGHDRRDETVLSVYWLHPAYWRRHPYEDSRLLTYSEIADELIPYLREQGYSHVALPPPQEQGVYPRGTGRPGRQLGLFMVGEGPGDANEFRKLVDQCHKAGIGVVLDWGPWRRNMLGHVLKFYDGTPLFLNDPKPRRKTGDEALDRRISYCCPFNLDRRPVQNFLISNALFWLLEFHMDGLCVDFDGMPEGQRSHDFLERLNQEIDRLDVGAFAISGESLYVNRQAGTVIQSPDLGFRYCLNRKWGERVLDYLALDPATRTAETEDVIRKLRRTDEDEGILTLVPGDHATAEPTYLALTGSNQERFRIYRVLLALFYAWPGKKITFMGGEFASRKRWDADGELDWHQMIHPDHQGIQDMVRKLNGLYRDNRALAASGGDGVEWLDGESHAKGVVAWLRRDLNVSDIAVAVFNFSNMHVYGYRLAVPVGGRYRVVIRTDDPAWQGQSYDAGEIGGFDGENDKKALISAPPSLPEDMIVEAEHLGVGRLAYAVRLSLPPNFGAILTPVKD